MGADMACFYSRLGHVTPEHPEVFFPTFFPVNYGKMAKDRHFASSCISLLLKPDRDLGMSRLPCICLL